MFRLLRASRRWGGNVKTDVLTLWFAGRDARTPWLPKLLGLLAVAYVLSPIDLIPDFIPVIGYLDDLILVPILVWIAKRMLPVEVLSDSRRRAEAWTLSGRDGPRIRWGIALILTAWVAIAFALWWCLRMK